MPAALVGALAPHCHNPEKIRYMTSVAKTSYSEDAKPISLSGNKLIKHTVQDLKWSAQMMKNHQ